MTLISKAYCYHRKVSRKIPHARVILGRDSAQAPQHAHQPPDYPRHPLFVTRRVLQCLWDLHGHHHHSSPHAKSAGEETERQRRQPAGKELLIKPVCRACEQRCSARQAGHSHRLWPEAHRATFGLPTPTTYCSQQGAFHRMFLQNPADTSGPMHVSVHLLTRCVQAAFSLHGWTCSREKAFYCAGCTKQGD